MKYAAHWLAAFAVASGSLLCAQITPFHGPLVPPDKSPHTVQFITVENIVKLEVLDWGGSGRPVVLLTGLGNDAHVYDQFAPKLTGAYHVYGITRRGFGASSVPEATGNAYDADRLGDDVLAVIDSLKLNKPVLVGHSIAGEELSSVGSRHPEKVSGLIYLNAAQPYAFYDRERGDFELDWKEIQKKVDQLKNVPPWFRSESAINELLETSLPAFERDLRKIQEDAAAMPETLRAFIASQPPRPPTPGPFAAIIAGTQKYTNISVPVLAIFALPYDFMPGASGDPATRAAFAASLQASVEARAKVIESGWPSARVVRIPNAGHYQPLRAAFRHPHTHLGTGPTHPGECRKECSNCAQRQW